MRNLNYFLPIKIIGLLFLLTACASVPQTPQAVINEANLTITAAANTAKSNFNAGTMTLAEKDQAVAKLKEYAAQVDRAQKLLDTGNPLEAVNQVKLMQLAIRELQQQVNAKRPK